MKTEKKERIKTRILILLVILSVIQMGIHWNKQTQGLPFSFINVIFANTGKTPSLDIDSLKEIYFRPDAVIVSIGTNHWRLDDRDSEYDKVWNDIRDNYLPLLIKQKAKNILPKEQWADITGSRCVKIDFSTNWPSGIVYWFEGVKPGEVKGFEGILSIAIIPEADVNQSVNTVYVNDGKQIYQYRIDIKNDFLPKSYYSKLPDELSNKNKSGQSLLSSYPNFVSEKDIYISKIGDQGNNYDTIKVSIPEPIILNSTNLENYNIQDNILLNLKESLSAQYSENSDSVLFTDTENLYKLFNNGVLEYKYIPANTGEAGDGSVAFNHALTFIEHRKHLIGDADIVLTYINKENNYYQMEFEYKINSVFAYYSDNQKSRISVPLVIKANSERILECRWVIRNFSNVGKQKSYSESFGDLLNKQIVSTYPEIIDRELKFFSRLEQGYIFRLTDVNGTMVVPNWIISTDVRDYFIPLSEKEG